MRCSKIQKYIALYDEGLDPDIKKKIDRHIAECGKCKEVFENLNDYKKFINSEELEEVPEKFEIKVIEKIYSGSKSIKERKSVYKYI